MMHPALVLLASMQSSGMALAQLSAARQQEAAQEAGLAYMRLKLPQTFTYDRPVARCAYCTRKQPSGAIVCDGCGAPQ